MGDKIETRSLVKAQAMEIPWSDEVQQLGQGQRGKRCSSLLFQQLILSRRTFVVYPRSKIASIVLD